MNKENKNYCPLDSGDISVGNKPVNVYGKRTQPNTNVICAIKMLKRQIGIKAGFAKCRSCNVDVKVGEFDGASSESITNKN